MDFFVENLQIVIKQTKIQSAFYYHHAVSGIKYFSGEKLFDWFESEFLILSTMISWAGNSWLWWGAVLSILGYLTASLATTHYMAVAPFSPVIITKNVSQLYQMSPGKQNQPSLWTTGLNLKQFAMITIKIYNIYFIIFYNNAYFYYLPYSKHYIWYGN